MQPIQRNEILPLGDYEEIRERFRARVIEEKKAMRRMQVSEIISVTFENRDTVLLQIQEMLRTERITREDAIHHEIVTYNDLIPGKDQLSATLYITISEKTERDRMLALLQGLEKHVYLEVDGEKVRAEGKRDEDGFAKTTAVHYFKFPLGEAASQALRQVQSGGRPKVALGVDHPEYSTRAELGGAMVKSLGGDLL